MLKCGFLLEDHEGHCALRGLGANPANYTIPSMSY